MTSALAYSSVAVTMAAPASAYVLSGNQAASPAPFCYQHLSAGRHQLRHRLRYQGDPLLARGVLLDDSYFHAGTSLRKAGPAPEP